jgi:CheY-like chemotaxis protein
MNERGPALEAGAEAERLNALGQIAGELIHDLANVVAVVHGRAALALGDARAGRPATAELERLVEASEDLSAILRDVLEVLRGSRLSPEVCFDPVRVIERSVRRFLDSTPPLEIRLISSLPAGVEVAGRASFLDRAVLNLLNNAARHARTEVRLTLSLCETTPAEVVLHVEDDGPGLSPALRSTAFDPLVRGKDSGAAGLGLSSANWAIRQLHGSIQHCGDGLLGGAAFEVRLPAVARRMPAAVPRLEVLVGRRLVLLEDDASVERMLVRLLGRMGAEVRAFNPSGASDEEVLQLLLRTMPDAILMDLRLGAREGSALWHALATRLPALARQVIFLTGLAPGDPEWESAHATGQPLLAKPVDIHELSTTLARILRGGEE